MRETWRTHPTLGLSLEMAEVILKRAWSRATASPGCQATWSPENPAYGQCAVTTALLWTVLKDDEGIEAEILRAEVEGFGSHYWLRLPDGTEVDMTRSQFPEGTVIPPGEPRTIEYLLDSDRAKSARTRERMNLLEQAGEEVFTAWLLRTLLGGDKDGEAEAAPRPTLAVALKDFEMQVERIEAENAPETGERQDAEKP